MKGAGLGQLIVMLVVAGTVIDMGVWTATLTHLLSYSYPNRDKQVSIYVSLGLHVVSPGFRGLIYYKPEVGLHSL